MTKQSLSVEVAAYRREGKYIERYTLDSSPRAMATRPLHERPHGFGVYIRNPLAFHVEDFPCDARGAYSVAECYARKLGEAFRYADALAEHLGCGVESSLTRAPFGEPPAIDDDTPPEDHRMTNYYECECGKAWEDVWSCACDDDCPSCGANISPHDSIADPACSCSYCQREG